MWEEVYPLVSNVNMAGPLTIAQKVSLTFARENSMNLNPGLWMTAGWMQAEWGKGYTHLQRNEIIQSHPYYLK